MNLSKIKRTARYILFLLVFTLLAAEILLRIYSPFRTTVVGDKIILTPNYNKVYNNDVFKQLDKQIIYKRNSIGLRGPEPPANVKDYLSIIAIGGSTTECMYISEGNTWEDQLSNHLKDSLKNTWVNNAGFEGHSTFGHITLLRDYVTGLKPKICLFLIGCNDVNRPDLIWADERFGKTKEKWLLQMARYSKLVNTGLALYRNHLARVRNVLFKFKFSLKDPPLVIPDSIIARKISEQLPLLKRYDERLQEIIRLCKKDSIEPIFMTQPTLMGIGIDSLTKADLTTVPVNAGERINGKLFYELLELYNNETRKVADSSGVFLIDLDNELPRSSLYYYDPLHYTNQGCAKVGSIIATRLIPHVQGKYPQYGMSP